MPAPPGPEPCFALVRRVHQVTVHIKGQTECFECQPKAAPKSYPVCTIRNTPDKPIHCVVWAKDLLFQRLFGRWILELRAKCE